ncbi:hypothetical protein GDO81_021381 [Engystomops pustulosus]|uniref:UPAR/Ly6 domain-containing protein n=1 Tax=Engystomops pustulosus TaxID=76066 RepID=A0AAV6ZF17_ENGPU|nr:hypothetical protein GDO81_021381 [Engystomops pustulosus]
MMTLTEKSLKDEKGEMTSAVLEKSCGSVYDCSHPATLTTEEFHVRVTTMCCNTDFCNNGTMYKSKGLNSTINGVTCLSCFEKNSQTCEVKKNIDCTGDEKHCVHYQATREGGKRLQTPNVEGFIVVFLCMVIVQGGGGDKL